MEHFAWIAPEQSKTTRCFIHSATFLLFSGWPICWSVNIAQHFWTGRDTPILCRACLGGLGTAQTQKVKVPVFAFLQYFFFHVITSDLHNKFSNWNVRQRTMGAERSEVRFVCISVQHEQLETSVCEWELQRHEKRPHDKHERNRCAEWFGSKSLWNFAKMKQVKNKLRALIRPSASRVHFTRLAMSLKIYD